MFWLVILLIVIAGIIFICNNWLERALSIIIITVSICLFKGWDLLDFWLAIVEQFQPILKIFEGL